MCGRGRSKSQPLRKTQLTVAGFEDGEGSEAKECGKPLTAGKHKGNSSSLEYPERMQPC